MPKAYEKYHSNQYSNEDKIAVIISPGYGAGWSTWAADEDKEAMVFDADLVTYVLNDQKEEALKLAKKKYPESYINRQELKIVWIDKNTSFRIVEYDGSERIEYLGNLEFYKA